MRLAVRSGAVSGRQYSSGMLGYYVSGDTSQWVEMGRGVDMNWTVIA